MKITLESNPSDAPCCVRIIAEDGHDRLIQLDWDWPSIASAFGWDIQSVHHEGEEHCEHSGTDGTVICPACHMPVSLFLHAAREWINDHNGEEAEDPGYFD